MKKGFKHSKETKKKISEAGKGRIFSEESKRKISESHKGMKHSKESKIKIGIAGKGRKVSDETRKKISKIHKGKKRSEKTRKKLSGKNCHFWKGGISEHRYKYSVDWTETLKRSIRERDNYTCQIIRCNKQQEDIAHDVHHIDYDKLNCNPSNLITLCHSCHSKTNGDRKKWIKYFNKLNKYYE